MKKLFIVRHAKSSWDNPAQTDFERPLNARGERDAPAMASKFAERKISVDAIITSPALRAKTTAAIFVDTLKISRADFLENINIYEATVSDLLEVIHALPEKYSSVMLFGHNPGFSQLAAWLSSEYVDMPTCAIVHLEFPFEKWAFAGKDTAKMVDFDYPKRDLAG